VTLRTILQDGTLDLGEVGAVGGSYQQQLHGGRIPKAFGLGGGDGAEEKVGALLGGDAAEEEQALAAGDGEVIH